MQYTPSHLRSGPLHERKSSNLLVTLNELEVDFATSPSVMDVDLTTSEIICTLPGSEKLGFSLQSTNKIVIDPIHIHMKQLSSTYAFYPPIVYYRKVDLSVGQVDGCLTANAMVLLLNDLSNWLLQFDAQASGDAIQSQYVRVGRDCESRWVSWS